MGTSSAAEIRPLAYTVAQAAEALSLSTSKVHKMIRGGQLHAVHIGRALRIPAWALDQLLEAPVRGVAS